MGAWPAIVMQRGGCTRLFSARRRGETGPPYLTASPRLWARFAVYTAGRRTILYGPMNDDIHRHFMELALREAAMAAEAGETPVGAIVAHGGRIIGRAHNQVELLKDPTAHAEIIAITQAASALGDWRLAGTTLYVTKEPCPMCAGAIVLARISTLVYGAADPQHGGAVSVFKICASESLNHRPAIIAGIMEAECREILQAFYRSRRDCAGKPGSESADG